MVLGGVLVVMGGDIMFVMNPGWGLGVRSRP